MYIMKALDARRFHSTESQSNKLDEILIPREKEERMAKLWAISNQRRYTRY